MVSERVSSSLCFTVSSSSTAAPLMLTRSTCWPCWHCLLPRLAVPYILSLSIYSQGWVTKEVTPLQLPKNDPTRIFYCSISEWSLWSAEKGVWQSCPFWILPWRTVVWARVAPPARVLGRRRLLSDQCCTLHLKAVVRKKMKLFQEASHLWLISHSKTSFVQCICARVGNSHEFGSEKILPL